MTETIEREIVITGKYLGGLSRSGEVSDWALNHIDSVRFFLEGYDELIAVFNNLPPYPHILKQMPATGRLKEAVKGHSLPFLDDMSVGNFSSGLISAREPMLLGQAIETGMIDSPSSEELNAAILTPSMPDVAPDVLAVGTIGHLIERTFFKWATKAGHLPEEGWAKDDLLKALKECLMWQRITNDEVPFLTRYFLRSREEGGLGWVSEDELSVFRKKLTDAVII